MKKLTTIFFMAALFVLLISVSSQAQTDTTKVPPQHGRNFVDNNGDGYNDNAPDHDGDGIPNGLDPDYLGQKAQKGRKAFVDLDGDGIKDNARVGNGKGRFGNATNPGNMRMGPKSGNTEGTSTSSTNQNNNGRGKKWGRK